jgi:glucosamine kinase
MVRMKTGLGLDVGGTSTRWAVYDSAGALMREGQAAGFSGLLMMSPAGRAEVQAVLADIAALAGPVQAACGGVTGFDGDAAAPLQEALSQALHVPAHEVRLFNDIELACRAAFEPGRGILVYAGTGSVAAHIDAQEVQHRAGGRGGLIDDGGSGYWIAREALRSIWRHEDEEPGVWRHSALAARVFEHIGGSDWATSRNWVYGASRGQLGELAVAVGASGDDDAVALHILQAAGRELARLGHALLRRCGEQPIRLAGRVWQLHPAIEASLREALPASAVQSLASAQELQAHHAAARIASGARITA